MGQGASGESCGEERVTSFEDVYQEIALNCFRYLGFKGFKEVDRLTIPEYELLIKAVQLKQIDMDYRLHMSAYLNFVVKAEKKAGKNKTVPVYKHFKKFYDYEKEIEKVLGVGNRQQNRFDGIGKLLKRKEDDNG
ncbi:MAG: hypothetical protein RR385_09405 [Clostridiales bacterium]